MPKKADKIVVAGQTYSRALEHHAAVVGAEPSGIACASIQDSGTAPKRPFRLSTLDWNRNAGNTAQL